MPFADYKDFADCKAKNKSKTDPSAYCGYIKNQVEGGKKKEEAMESPEHEAYHLEEAIRKTEAQDYVCPKCGSRNTGEYEKSGVATCWKCGEVFDISSDFPKQEALTYCPYHRKDIEVHTPEELQQDAAPALSEETDRQTRLPKGVRHTVERMGGENWAPEPEIEKASAEFIRNLSATIDLVTLMAKESGYHDVSEKVSPTQPTYMYEVNQDMADVIVKQAKGFGVEVNWFNTTISELQDIVKSANKFFVDSGWNSKETVKEYEAHKKKWGNDWM